MRKLALVFVPLLLIACGREAVAPAAGPTPSFSAASTWTRASFFLDFVVPGTVNTCLGEAIHGYGEVPYKMHEVSNGAGGYSYQYQLLPVTPWGPQYSLTGLTSGKVWWYKNGLPYNESYRLGPGEVLQLKTHEAYETENGERLFVDNSLHLTTNANGELVVDRVEPQSFQCGKRH